MCIIGHSAGYRPDYANLARNYCRLGVQTQLAEQAAHRAAAFETARKAFGAKRASANSGNCANPGNPRKMGVGRADHLLAESCGNCGNLSGATRSVGETAGMPEGSAENAENQKSPGKRASDSAAIVMQKIAESAKNPSHRRQAGF